MQSVRGPVGPLRHSGVAVAWQAWQTWFALLLARLVALVVLRYFVGLLLTGFSDVSTITSRFLDSGAGAELNWCCCCGLNELDFIESEAPVAFVELKRIMSEVYGDSGLRVWDGW